MNENYFKAFLNGEIVIRVNEDESLLLILERAVKKIYTHSLYSAISLGKLAYQTYQTEGCLLWIPDIEEYHWANREWYVKCGHKAIPIENVIFK